MERGAVNVKRGLKRFTVFGVQGLGCVLSSDLRLTRRTCQGTLNVRGKKDGPSIHKLGGG